MSMLRSGFIVAFFTLISRILGLLRELFLAHTFGTTQAADCLNVAFKLPNLFRRIFGEGALSSVFVPIYSAKKNQSSNIASTFANQIFSALIYYLLILTMIMQIFMPQIMMLLAPGFASSAEKFELSIALSRITIPYLIFISLAALLGGMLNSIDKFKSFAATPIILNIAIIIGCLIQVKADTKPIIIATTVLIGGILQLIFMYYNAYRAGIRVIPTLKIYSKDTKYLLKQMVPAIFSNSITQISLFISNSLASFIQGAVSILSYAERLYQLPLSLIGTTFGTILLPKLSKSYNEQNFIQANQILENAIKFAIYISLPCSVGICLLSSDIVTLVYLRGAFTQLDVAQTALCLTGFSFGLLAFILNKILTPAFYANNDQQTPFKINTYSILINIVLNVMLMKVHGTIGIAVGSSLAAWVNTFMLYQQMQKKLQFNLSAGINKFIFKIVVCNFFMSIMVLLTKYFILSNINLNQSIKLLCTILIGIICYLMASLMIKIVSKNHLISILKHF